jgi:hypothetical protein
LCDGSEDKESGYLWKIRHEVRRFPEKDDQENRNFTEKEISLPILWQDIGEAHSGRGLELPEMPQIKHWWSLYANHPDRLGCSGSHQATQGSAEINLFSIFPFFFARV